MPIPLRCDPLRGMDTPNFGTKNEEEELVLGLWGNRGVNMRRLPYIKWRGERPTPFTVSRIADKHVGHLFHAVGQPLGCWNRSSSARRSRFDHHFNQDGHHHGHVHFIHSDDDRLRFACQRHSRLSTSPQSLDRRADRFGPGRWFRWFPGNLLQPVGCPEVTPRFNSFH